MDFDDDLDTTHLLCPLPVLKARKKLQTMQKGAILRMTTTDPAAVIDVPHFCREAGHELHGHEVQDAGDVFYIEKRL